MLAIPNDSIDHAVMEKSDKVKVIPSKCVGCKICLKSCPYESIEMREGKAFILPSCVECKMCISSCKFGAIVYEEDKKEVKDFSEIKIGIHGLYIEKGPYSGLLLPQVSTEYGWNTDEFLQQTCRKAGLPAGAYKDPEARVFMFSADIF